MINKRKLKKKNRKNRKNRIDNRKRKQIRKRRKRNSLNSNMKQQKGPKQLLKNIKKILKYNNYTADKKLTTIRYKSQERCSKIMRGYNNKEKDQLNLKTGYNHCCMKSNKNSITNNSCNLCNRVKSRTYKLQ